MAFAVPFIDSEVNEDLFMLIRMVFPGEPLNAEQVHNFRKDREPSRPAAGMV